MIHDDLRVEWIRQQVSSNFNLTGCPDSFDELLCRADGEEEQKIIRFLDDVAQKRLLFFKTIREEEIEVEIPGGKLTAS